MLFDYSQVSADSIREDVADTLGRADSIVDDVVRPDTPLSYETVLAPLEEAADLISGVYGRAPFLGHVHPDPDVRAAGHEVEERISKWGVELAFREDLYEKVKAYSETEGAAALTGERARLLEFSLRDFRKAGHELDPATRAEVKQLMNRLVELGVAFERNIAEHQDGIVVRPEDLSGLPDGYLDTLDPGEEEGTYRVSLAYPHVIPFLDTADRRDLRRELHCKFNNRAVDENRPILEEAVEIRRRIAELFDRPSWAHHQLDERMARTPEAVEEFYQSLIEPLQTAATADIARMAELLREDTGDDTLQVYDWRYYDTRLRKTEYGVDPAAVAVYFPLQQVIDGMLDLTAEVFGLRYERMDASAWHPDVITYAIHDAAGDELIAHFHMDLFPREGKFSHAAAFPLVGGHRLPDGSYQKPVSAIVANFTKPAGGRPSLLQHQEVETFFHEFGHILHQTLTKAELIRFSGTSTERDFVEAPSQIMQHWTWKPDVLRRFALHHETGEPIPDEIVDRLTEARQLNVAVAKLRQIQFGVFDMRLHGASGPKDIDRILEDATAISMLPHVEETFFPASFGHLMGGYDAGYYGYLWSEVFGDDMFSRFEEAGYTDPGVGAAYRREILEMGGTLDGMDLLRNFLGREPNNEAFLTNLGITP